MLFSMQILTTGSPYKRKGPTQSMKTLALLANECNVSGLETSATITSGWRTLLLLDMLIIFATSRSRCSERPDIAHLSLCTSFAVRHISSTTNLPVKPLLYEINYYKLIIMLKKQT